MNNNEKNDKKRKLKNTFLYSLTIWIIIIEAISPSLKLQNQGVSLALINIGMKFSMPLLITGIFYLYSLKNKCIKIISALILVLVLVALFMLTFIISLTQRDRVVLQSNRVILNIHFYKKNKSIFSIFYKDVYGLEVWPVTKSGNMITFVGKDKEMILPFGIYDIKYKFISNQLDTISAKLPAWPFLNSKTKLLIK